MVDVRKTFLVAIGYEDLKENMEEWSKKHECEKQEKDQVEKGQEIHALILE